MRYMGTGATGVAADDNTVPAENFTFSTMVLPAGCEGPLHLHTDAEEIFFIMRGERIRLMIEHNGELIETILGNRDLILFRGRLSRPRERGPRGSVNVRDDRIDKPETPTLSGKPSARQGQASQALIASGRR